MKRISRLGSIAALTIMPTLQAQSGLPPGTWRVADVPVAIRPAVSHGDLIVMSLQEALLRELNDELEEGGPQLAIKSCHVDVVGVIQRIGRAEGIAAGRTSHLLRNPANAPRSWAAALVASNAGRRAKDVDGYVVDLGDRIGLLRPIAHRSLCASCHGGPDKITPDVQRALNARYPGDRAVGFSEGDIRGWFWVEVPKGRQ
jgi:hypothetical protein